MTTGARGRCGHGAWVIVALLSIGAVAGCRNPFLPPTGEPAEGGKLRTTPEGVIEQLKQSYLTQQLSLFKDLLADPGFRFYVSPSILGELHNLDKSKTENVAAAQAPLSSLVPAGVYTYLGYREEVLAHQNLFRSAYSIRFEAGGLIESVVYRDTLVRRDTSIVTDTIYRDSCKLSPLCPDSLFGGSDTAYITRTVVKEVYDTTEAAIRTWYTQLTIDAPQVRQEYGTPGAYTFDIAPQVFYLRRDADRLWKIVKWFELDF